MRPDAFSHVETWIFDLDNTLYPPHVSLWQQIDERIKTYVANYLKVTPEEAFLIQKDYYRRYGTSLRGLMIEHGMEPDDFLRFAHDIDHSPLQANPELGKAIAALKGRKFIFTSGTHSHAAAVTRRLGIEHHFDGVFDVVAAGLLPKPHRPAYDLFCETHKVDPTRAAMFEDLARNLEQPAAMGMATVLVVPSHTQDLMRDEWELEGRDGGHIQHVTDDLTAFLHKIAEVGRSISP
jgi:putative hydrolase of the HAD superfamily